MAIVNRDLDQSQQKEVVRFTQFNRGVGSTVMAGGASFLIGSPIPFTYTIESGSVYVLGVSGAPQMRLLVDRFAGGQTRMVVSISGLVLTAYGTSGVLGFSGFAASGSTLLAGQMGDVLSFDVVGANTAITDAAISIVVKKSADIVTYNGL